MHTCWYFAKVRIFRSKVFRIDKGSYRLYKTTSTPTKHFHSTVVRVLIVCSQRLICVEGPVQGYYACGDASRVAMHNFARPLGTRDRWALRTISKELRLKAAT